MILAYVVVVLSFGLFKHESFSDLIVETVNMIASLVTPIVDEFFFVLFSML